MRTIAKPADGPKSVFETCISKVRNLNLKLRLKSITNLVETAAIEYDQEAINKSWINIAEHTNVGGVVSRDEMKKVYERMVGETSPGRAIYNKIRLSSDQNLCPFCAQRPVSTLDHYLPQAKFPSLVVVPHNLIPACSDCNKIKTADVPVNAESQMLHPYYDDVTNEQWLFAEVIISDPASISFYVTPPENWPQVLKDRVRYHFSIFELSDLYIPQAAVELSNIRGQIKKLYDQGGRDIVREHLQEAEDSRQNNHLNSWQTAMYQALAISDWYCNGGFN